MAGNGGYNSEFEDITSRKRKRTYDDQTKIKHQFLGHSSRIPSKSTFVDAYEKEERKSHFAKFLSMNAYERHQKLVHDYLSYYGGKLDDFKRDSSKDKTDADVIRENHKFVWEEEDNIDSWEKKIAKKYYDKLFKEYCICDLSRYKENKFAMRWRIEKEVTEGKGQFLCGARKCDLKEALKTWEVNFAYIEHNIKNNTLVKLRLCPDCSYKLNYHSKHRKVKKKHKSSKRKKKERNRRDHSRDKSDSESKDFTDSEEKEKEGKLLHQETESIWTKSLKEDIEKSKEEEFDDYLEDLFM